MKGQEVAIKIISKLDLIYGDVFDQAKVREVIEGILYDYTVEDKPTSLAVIDNMSDMILMYLATRKTEGLSNSSLKGYGRKLGKFADYMRKNVEDITTMDIRIYISNRSKEGLKNTTLANDTDILRGFFNFLEDEEYIVKSPMRKIKTIKVEKKLREALTKEQFETLRLGAKTLRQKALLELLYSTGCRLEEIEQMKKAAQAEIQRDRERAADQLKKEIVALSLLAAGKVVEKNLAASENEALVGDFIDKLDKDKIGDLSC